MLNEDAPKIYGLDKINERKPIYITEGPFDSTFVENSVAMCGSDLDIGRLVGAIIYGVLITNLATEKSSNEYPTPLTKESKSLSGQLK